MAGRAERTRQVNARSGKNTDPVLSDDEAVESFERQFPGVDLDLLLANTADRQKARAFSTLLAREHLIRTWGRAYPTPDGPPVKFYHQQIRSLIESDARIAGNLGAVETLLPSSGVELLRALMSTDEDQSALLIGRVLRLPLPKDEKVIPCNTVLPAKLK